MNDDLNFHENIHHNQEQIVEEQMFKYFLAEKLKNQFSMNEVGHYFNAESGDSWEV